MSSWTSRLQGGGGVRVDSSEVTQYVSSVLGLCCQRNLVCVLAVMLTSYVLGHQPSLSLLAHLLRGNGAVVAPVPAYLLPAVCPQVCCIFSLGSSLLFFKYVVIFLLLPPRNSGQ